MNKFDTSNNGKQPVFLDDFRFIENTNRNTFFAVLKSISKENWILYGCKLTNTGGNNYEVTAGAVVIDGEVLNVDAQSFSCVSINNCYYQLSESNIPDGLRIFGDGLSHYVYKKRIAAIAELSSPNPALTCSVSLTAIADKKFEPIGSQETADAYFVTPEHLNRSASLSGASAFTALAPVFFSINSVSYIKGLTNGSTRYNSVFLSLDLASPGSPITELNIAINKVFIMSQEFLHPVIIQENGTVIQGYISVTSNTPTHISVKKMDATPFTALSTVIFGFDTVSIQS